MSEAETESTEPADSAVATAQPSTPEPKPEPKPDWWQRRYTFTGTAVGMVFLWLSLTPSLLPRGPLFQGLVSGGAGAIGYGLGVFAVWLVRYMLSRPSSPRPPRWAWPILVVVAIIGLVFAIYFFHVWQDQVRDLMGVPRLQWYNYPQSAIIGVIVLFMLVEIGQLVGKLVRFLVRQLDRIAPPRVSAVIVVTLLLSLTIAILNGVVIRGAMSAMNSTFASVNDEMDPNNPAPTTPQRSGGPGSLVTWSSLGHQGRVFVAGGPTVEQLTEFNGEPAIEPIRAYAGKNSAKGIKAAAELAARELERAGGFERKVIAVATTTGTGWINEAEASSLEYMYNGDTAIVSMQYSFLPSWLSFLVDKENARQAGQALFEAVDERLRAMPEAQRPKIVVFGESLGSFGGEAPFLSPNNIIARTNGALFSGPTFNNTMWDDVTVNRDAGSPMWLPIYDEGANIRFAARPDNLDRPDKPWGYPRIVYLQHASDPITWWNPDLLFAEPDWLREPRGYDVSPDMNWIPIVTFLQVSADMAVAIDVPDGHGHRYVRDAVNAWAAIMRPPGWTPEKTERLRAIVKAPE
ncbi:alpha/beta-hydrolase family protein [Mycobacterium sp. CVI_P3]|uniref:Alpha/beta-hydrolase family protein n=1 Tax=Mycobacterium pinniadriaticum TaxID=2994102 RepID=A0ABT3SNS4_9MYCO|nr:alpha/beta-hydrolase family protein [Mycobacterium pinniadriaticum]MCX2934774.1 alpha/beta-hydrolase family protein [Mycobacterium pinniadriaticum]MCX2941181.1 alpha/beta-hydrolase family protein [Mycobacterium pinniadriaticum]